MGRIITFIRNSLLLGLFIALAIDLIGDLSLLNDLNLYVFSMILSMVTGATVEIVYKKVIIRKHVSPFTKILCVYGITASIYTFANGLFLGLEILTNGLFYLYGFLILILVTPMFYFVNNQMKTYEHHLSIKKKSIDLRD